MCIQKLHHFCNRSSPDDGPKTGRKYLGNKRLWKIYQSIPAEYYKINTSIWKDQYETFGIKYIKKVDMLLNLTNQPTDQPTYQTLQNRCKKCVDRKVESVEKDAHLVPFHERILVRLWTSQVKHVLLCWSKFEDLIIEQNIALNMI